MPTSTLLIERCAAIADDHIERLKGAKTTARTHSYDRHSQVEIDYAILQLKRVATAIRALDISKLPVFAPDKDPRFEEARALLRELLPGVEQSRASGWRQETIERIKKLMRD